MHSINGSTTPEDIKGQWRTPPYFFRYLKGLYNFNLDAYADENNKLCPNFIGKDDNAHDVDWRDYVDSGAVIAFANPEYAAPNIRLCLEAARREARRGGTVVVLIPNQPTQYWADIVVGQANRVTLTLGRISFLHPESGDPISGNPGGSAIVTYLPRSPRVRHVNTITDYINIKDIING